MVTPERPSMDKQRLHEPRTHSLSLISWRNADFVDPKLRRLVGMHVVYRRGHADDRPSEQGNGEVMPWIGEELRAPTCINVVIKNIRQHVIEQTCFVTTQHPDNHGLVHDQLCLNCSSRSHAASTQKNCE